MRGNKRGKSDIVIDLTSMLDVIFILLLVVMVGQKTTASQSAEEYEKLQEAAELQIAEAENAKLVYEDIADSYSYVCVASASVPFDADEIQKRKIMLLVNGSEMRSFELIGNDVEESFAAFKAALEEYISEYKDCPVILSLNDDDDRILYRDEKRITEIYNELSENNPNVYIKGNLSEVVS